MKQRTFALIKAKLFQPSKEDIQAVKQLASINKSVANILAGIEDQPDLMHVEAILVTKGMNGNDDGFLHDELWGAKGSPIFKPMNWAHEDSEILGVMYSAEARDLDGKVLTEKPDSEIAYEVAIKGAVWHYLPHIKSRAAEIQERATKGNLYVSMECWFDDYDYLLANDDGSIFDIIQRADATIYLDKYLRCQGGSGTFNKKRIGRALKGVVFGGVGFVEQPANSRSLILNIQTFDKKDKTEAENSVLHTNQLESSFNVNHGVKEDFYMNDLNKAVAGDTEAAVRKVFEEKERASAADKLKAQIAENENKVSQLEAKLRDKDTAVTSASKQLEQASALVDELALNVVKAGATSHTPEEIAKIDRAFTGAEKFAAKIAWIRDSLKASVNVDEVKQLRAENKALKATVRKDEVTKLLASIFEAAELESLVAKASEMSDADYKSWLEDKVLFAKKMDEKMQKFMKKEEKDKGKGGVLEPKDGAEQVDMHGVELNKMGGKKGVPSSVPNRFKIAGDMNIEEVVEEVTEVDLSGSTAENVSDEQSRPMRGLVASLLGKEKQEDKKEGGK